MSERELRNKAKVWLISNNNIIKEDLKTEGLQKVIEDAFLAGAAVPRGDKLRKKIDRLKRSKERDEDIISDLQEEVDQLQHDLDAFTDIREISVENIR